MAISEKKLRANRENAKKSTGPKTVEGKNVSRRNALKHGLSGKGKVLPDAIQQQINGRVDQWTALMKPAEGPEAWLVARAAALSARVDAAVKCEAERREQARLRAESGQLAQARAARLGKQLISRKNVDEILPQLEATAAGCDWMLERWKELEMRRQEGDGSWSQVELRMAMKLGGHSLSDLADDPEVQELVRHCCRARESQDGDTVLEYRLQIARDAQDFEYEPYRGAAPDRISLDGSRHFLAAYASRQIKRLNALRTRRAKAEAEAPAMVSTIDLSREGERLRRYEASLDRQLHLALQRAELLRQERTIEDEDEELPRNEPRATDRNRQREEFRGPCAEDARAESDFRRDPCRRLGLDPAPESWVARQPTPSLAEGAWGSEPASAEPIAPRRKRIGGSEQSVAHATTSGPPLRGRLPGREMAGASERRGGYLSPEARVPRMTVAERVRLATGGRPMDAPGLLLHEGGRSPIVERPDTRGGRGEPGGTRAMVACEPGQGGNAAAISIASMCPGAPPRLSPASAASLQRPPQTDGA